LFFLFSLFFLSNLTQKISITVTLSSEPAAKSLSASSTLGKCSGKTSLEKQHRFFSLLLFFQPTQLN
jgi:hypothetical protein